MSKIIKQIPNAITMVNLACGCLGVVYCLEGKYLLVLMLIGIALLADFADGLMAKVLDAKSELGVQLDSLADAVSFGVLPGMIMYTLIEAAVARPFIDYDEPFLRLEHAGFLFTIFAIVRLGKFNIDTRQTDSFLGLATPAASLFVAGLLMIKHYDVMPYANWLNDEFLLVSMTVALAALMISEIPMFSFKSSGTLWKGNEDRVIFIVLSIVLILLLKWAALPAIILLYIAVSIIEDLVRKPKTMVSSPDSAKIDQSKKDQAAS